MWERFTEAAGIFTGLIPNFKLTDRSYAALVHTITFPSA